MYMGMRINMEQRNNIKCQSNLNHRITIPNDDFLRGFNLEKKKIVC